MAFRSNRKGRGGWGATLVGERAEGLGDVLVELVELLGDGLLAVLGTLELLLGEAVDDVGAVLLDLGPGHVRVVGDGGLCAVVEVDHVLEHAGGLVEGAVGVVLGDTVLLQTGDATGTLVEAGQLGTQVRRVAGIGRHLGQTTRDLTQSLGPSRGRVGHHGHVVALVTEVFGERDTRVDRRLSRSHGHVGCVGHQRSTLHDRELFAVPHERKLGELGEHFGHLVSPLSTAYIGDDVRVRVFGERLGDDGLATAEGTGDGGGTTLDAGEERVEDTLAGEQRVVGLQLLGDGTGRTDGPDLEHGVLLLLALEFGLEHDVVDRVRALLGDVGDGAHSTRAEHELVVLEQRVLVDGAEDVTTADVVADLELAGSEVPRELTVERLRVDTSGNVDTAALLHDGLERTLDAVVNVLHETGAELDGEGLASTEHRVTDGNAGSLLVHLDGDLVGVDSDDLTDELVVADTHELVHARADHVLGDDDGTRDTEDSTEALLALLIADLGEVLLLGRHGEGLGWIDVRVDVEAGEEMTLDLKTRRAEL
ncbi:hypothetical protein L1887_42625 [Cichorium endivia]|nr:hypothetical protein L1887_42625 [Cichorium endivia]